MLSVIRLDAKKAIPFCKLLRPWSIGPGITFVPCNCLLLLICCLSMRKRCFSCSLYSCSLQARLSLPSTCNLLSFSDAFVHESLVPIAFKHV